MLNRYGQTLSFIWSLCPISTLRPAHFTPTLYQAPLCSPAKGQLCLFAIDCWLYQSIGKKKELNKVRAVCRAEGAVGLGDNRVTLSLIILEAFDLEWQMKCFI